MKIAPANMPAVLWLTFFIAFECTLLCVDSFVEVDGAIFISASTRGLELELLLGDWQEGEMDEHALITVDSDEPVAVLGFM